MNKVFLLGNLTKDIELRYMPNGTAVANTGIAVNEKYKGQDGQVKEKVTFVDIAFFGRTAEVANQYLKKGSQVLVEGKLNLESWKDKNGQNRSKHTVTITSLKMLGGGDNTKRTPSQQQANPPQQKLPEVNVDDEEIPF